MNSTLENNKAMSFLKNSKYYFLITIASLTFLEIQPFNDTVRFILFLLLILYSCSFFIVNIKKLSTTPLFWIISAFLGASTLIAIIHGDIMRVGFAHIQYIFLFLNASMFISSEDLFDNITVLAKWFTIFGLFLCLFPPLASLIFKDSEFFHSISNSLWQKLINAPYDFPNRYTSVLNPNHTAIMIGVASLFSLLLLFHEKNIFWIISAIANVACSIFFIVFAYASRATMVFIFISYVPFVLLNLLPRQERKQRLFALSIIILGLSILFVLLILFFFNDSFQEIILYKVLRIDNLSSACGRDIRHELAIKGALSSPILGVSLSDYDTVFSILDGSRIPHNLYLDVWLRFGTPCFIIFVVIMLYTIITLFIRVFKTPNGKEITTIIFIISLFLGLATQSFAEDCVFDGYYIKGFMLFIILGITCCKEKALKEKL